MSQAGTPPRAVPKYLRVAAAVRAQIEDGKRQQLTRTFDKLKEARAELSRIRHQTDKGTFVKPSDMTINQYIDEYLVGATRG